MAKSKSKAAESDAIELLKEDHRKVEMAGADVPCGPAIVLTCIALFLISLLLGRIIRNRTVQPISHESGK